MMNWLRLLLIILICPVGNVMADKEVPSIPGIDDFLLEQSLEVALAKSAAPKKLSDDANIWVLKKNGYQQVIKGSSQFHCMVVRSWAGPMYTEAVSSLYDPESVVPECIDAKAFEVIWPLQVFRTNLAIQQTPPKVFTEKVKQAFATGKLKRMKGVAISYMLSNAMVLAKDFPGPPHIMFYVPDDYTKEMSGNLGWKDQVVYHEGGPEQPYTALMIMRTGVEPEFTSH